MTLGRAPLVDKRLVRNGSARPSLSRAQVVFFINAVRQPVPYGASSRGERTQSLHREETIADLLLYLTPLEGIAVLSLSNLLCLIIRNQI